MGESKKVDSDASARVFIKYKLFQWMEQRVKEKDFPKNLLQASIEANTPQQFFDNYLVTKLQLAGSLGLSPSFINKLMASGEIPYYQIGRAVRFNIAEVMAWLSKRRRP